MRVISTERDVDPVGACVGMKGSRVQAIIRELRGERIDLIEWSEDPAVFAANALSPAKVSKVEINSFEEKKLTVTVPEDQLSLAIGKKGQNVRLAAKLVGWHIDIRSAEEAPRAAAAQLDAVMAGRPTTPSGHPHKPSPRHATPDNLEHPPPRHNHHPPTLPPHSVLLSTS